MSWSVLKSLRISAHRSPHCPGPSSRNGKRFPSTDVAVWRHGSECNPTSKSGRYVSIIATDVTTFGRNGAYTRELIAPEALGLGDFELGRIQVAYVRREGSSCDSMSIDRQNQNEYTSTIYMVSVLATLSLSHSFVVCLAKTVDSKHGILLTNFNHFRLACRTQDLANPSPFC